MNKEQYLEMVKTELLLAAIPENPHLAYYYSIPEEAFKGVPMEHVIDVDAFGNWNGLLTFPKDKLDVVVERVATYRRPELATYKKG